MVVKLKQILLGVLAIALCIALCSCGSTKYQYEDTGISQAELEKITKEAKKEILAEQFFWDLTKDEAAPFIGSDQHYYECFVDAVRGTIYIRYQIGGGNYKITGISPIFLPNGRCAFYLEDIENISSFKEALGKRVSSKIEEWRRIH